MNKEATVRLLTGVIAISGIFLTLAQNVTSIPELAGYSHWGPPVTAFAIAFKQFAIIGYEMVTGKKWEEPKP